MTTDYAGLIGRLRQRLGPNGILTDPADTDPYCEDWRRLYHGRTPAVQRPANTAEVAYAVRFLLGAESQWVTGQIIAIDGSDHGVREIQMPHCFRDVTRFFVVKLTRLALPHRAETTVPRADITAQHECGGAIRPTFKDVRTPGFLTDGMQVQTLDQLEQMVLVRRITQTNPQPFRLWLTWFLVENLKLAGQ